MSADARLQAVGIESARPTVKVSPRLDGTPAEEDVSTRLRLSHSHVQQSFHMRVTGTEHVAHADTMESKHLSLHL